MRVLPLVLPPWDLNQRPRADSLLELSLGNEARIRGESGWRLSADIKGLGVVTDKVQGNASGRSEMCFASVLPLVSLVKLALRDGTQRVEEAIRPAGCKIPL